MPDDLVGRVAPLGVSRDLTDADRELLHRPLRTLDDFMPAPPALSLRPKPKPTPTLSETATPETATPALPDLPLIPVTPGEVGGVACLTVDARALHQSLGVGKFFANWIKARIEKYGFEAGVDYVKTQLPNLASGNLQGSSAYTMTLECAKELAMAENNDRGRQVRRYFIACERQLLTQPQTPTLTMTLKEGRRSVTLPIRQDQVLDAMKAFWRT